jgi:1-phosphatidylinositol phosphodiesterase
MAADPKSWMTELQDKRIYDLLVPGTHDSGTEGFPVGSPSRTQYYKIDEQLDGGVRFLDMRLAYNSAEENFHVVHSGDVISYLNFDTVVQWCADFLSANQSETILMSVKQEGSLPGSDDAFALGLSNWHDTHSRNGDWDADLWYTKSDEFPTVAEAKSKIVLLRRYTVSSPNGGVLFAGGFDLTYINGSHSGDFELVPSAKPTPESPSVFGSLQDRYELDPDDKKDAVSSALTNMGSNDAIGPKNEKVWHLNFASTSNPGPLRAANVVNPWLTGRLAGITGMLYGVLITDYAQPELWKQIYEFNFQ